MRANSFTVATDQHVSIFSPTKWLSEVGFEPTPSYEDQKSQTLYYRVRCDP